MSGVSWEVVEARRAAYIYRKYGLKCRIVRCKHVPSYLAVYHDDTDEYYERLRIAKEACDHFGIEHYVNRFVSGEIAKKRGITTY
jgi:hypothetical protein